MPVGLQYHLAFAACSLVAALFCRSAAEHGVGCADVDCGVSVRSCPLSVRSCPPCEGGRHTTAIRLARPAPARLAGCSVRRCDTPLRVPRKIPQLLKRSCRGSRREASLPRGRCGRVVGRGDRSDLPVGRRSDGYPLLPRGAAKTDAQLHRAPSSSPHGEPLPRKVC